MATNHAIVKSEEQALDPQHAREVVDAVMAKRKAEARKGAA